MAEAEECCEGPEGIWEAKGDPTAAWVEVILASLAQVGVHLMIHIPGKALPPFEPLVPSLAE